MEWKAASAFVTGAGHLQEGTPCQDRASHLHDGDFHAVALADGAGSCSLSQIGAELAVNAALRLGRDHFDEWYPLDESAIALLLEERLSAELREASVKLGAGVHELACTLLFVLVKDSRCLAGHIGDGVIAMRSAGELAVLSHPENGRFLNETYFVTMTPLGEHFRLYKRELRAPADFMLMSDGTAASLYMAGQRQMEPRNVGIILDYLIEEDEQEAGAELAGLMSMLTENTDDDCSMAVLTGHPAADASAASMEAGTDAAAVADTTAEAPPAASALTASNDGRLPEALVVAGPVKRTMQQRWRIYFARWLQGLRKYGKW